jgi:hypothetical protein
MSSTTDQHAADYLYRYRWVLKHALRNEMINADEDKKQLRRIAAVLRRTAQVPLFAAGQAGASAADDLAAATPTATGTGQRVARRPTPARRRRSVSHVLPPSRRVRHQPAGRLSPGGRCGGRWWVQ